MPYGREQEQNHDQSMLLTSPEYISPKYAGFQSCVLNEMTAVPLGGVEFHGKMMMKHMMAEYGLGHWLIVTAMFSLLPGSRSDVVPGNIQSD